MIKVGLTGSIGMGKTTTAAMFREAGVPVYDADAAVHELYRDEAVPFVEEAFPETTVDGQVDRDKLGKAVLGNPAAIRKLEGIVHPLVHQKEREFLAAAAGNNQPVVLLDIPLLFETGGESRVDLVIVVSAGPEQQRKRVLAREGMTEEKFNAILARQVPDEEKRRRADFVIDTSRGLEHARDQVRKIIEEIVEKSVHQPR